MGGFSLIHSCWRVHRSPGLFLCFGGWGGLGGWVGGRNNVPFAAFAWTFFCYLFLCYACTLPHHLARNTSCYACTLLHHLYATRRATLLVASVMLRLQAAASSCTQHVMLRLHAAASSLRNTSCYAFGRKCYVTLARCRIILHATRHATLARGRIIFTQHVVLLLGGWVGLGGWGLGGCGGASLRSVFCVR